MQLPKDLLNNIPRKPKVYLCETDKTRICKLETSNMKGSFKFNAISELSFEVARLYNDIVTGKTNINPFYDKIEALRLIELEELGYFELQGPELTSDGIKESKSCTAYSSEYTLSQKYLTNFKVNMGTVDSLEVLNASSENNIVPITLYNSGNPKLSLLHLVLDDIYGWKIGRVDASLQTLSRQFEIDRESVYDFLMNEVCEKFNCYIVFDTLHNTINIYAESLTSKFIGDGNKNSFTIVPPFAQIGTVSVDGYKTTRWQYNSGTGLLILEDTPEYGAHIEVVDGALTEWETDVFVSFENLAQEANINYDADSIKTKLTVTYGDDYDIREVNLGLPYLTDISYYYTVDWMGQDLYDTYTKYLQKSNESQSKYANNSQEILRLNDCIAYEKNRLSLEYSLASVSSSTVGTYYTRQENLDGSYYYSEVSLPSEYVVGVDYYSNVTTNVNEEKVSDLYEVLKNYFYAYFNGQADKVAEALNSLNELTDNFKFMRTYTVSYLSNSLQIATSTEDMDTAIYNFLAEMWVELGKTPLETLYLAPYKTIQETNIKAGWSNKNDPNYGNYYPVTLFIKSVESAISERDNTINSYTEKQGVFQKSNLDISNSLLMRNNFTEEQLIRLSAFLREDELHLDDIVETSTDDLSSSFKIKQDAMESGRIELQKLCQPQLQFSMTMANIYALPEFGPIVHQFQLGKVIKVCLRRDYIKQSRLLQVDINFDDFSDFSCEFGELTNLRTQSDIHADLLSKAITAGKSVATNSSYWTRGSDTATSTQLKIQQGLLDATTQIKAMDGSQGIVIDKYGIHLREVNPTTGEINPKQGWITNNKFLYTDDGFKSTKSVFGEYTYDGDTYYGILAEALVGNLLIGSQIKLENNSGTMTFDDNGLSVNNGINYFNVSPNSEALLSISNSTEKLFYVDDVGNLNLKGTIVATSGSIGGCDIVDGVLKIKAANIAEKLTAEQIDVSNLNVDAASITSGTIDSARIPDLSADKITSGTINASNVTITNLTVDAAQIISGTIDSARIPDLSADKITSGTIDATDVNITNLTVDAASITSGVFDSARIPDLSADKIVSGTIDADNVTISGTLSAATISAANLTAGSNDAAITFNGAFTAPKATITGTITADYLTANSGGQIAGWTIDNNSMRIGELGFDNSMWLCNTGTITEANIGTGSGKDWCIGVGGNFGVKKDGTLYASNANISGEITGTSGKIGSWNISPSGYIYYGTIGNSNSIFLAPTGVQCQASIGGSPVNSSWLLTASSSFGVSSAGALYATEGSVGGWEISDSCLYGHGGANAIRLYPKGIQFNNNTFYLVIYDSGGAVPIGGITSSGWKSV